MPIKRFIYTMATASLLLAACMHTNEEEVSNARNQIDVVLVIQLPVFRQPILTYALGEADENLVRELDVLVFKVDPNDVSKEYFAYQTTGTNVSDEGNTTTQKFRVSLANGQKNQYRLVVLSNARQALAQLGNIETTEEKTDVLGRLVLSTNEAWNTSPGHVAYADMPMWGESGQVLINKNQSIGDIRLLRMLARIDVVVASEAQAAFRLQSVRLYNYNTNGLVAPFLEAAYWDGSNVLQPSVPQPSGNTQGPLVYAQPTQPGVSFVRDIYALEAKQVASSQYLETPCLVVGGVYANEGKETFYRIDFASRDVRGNVVFFDLLRNHLYNIKITHVAQSGYDTPQEAFASESVNIVSGLTVWNQGELTEIIYDDQYLLGVSKSSFAFPYNQLTDPQPSNELVVSTDFPQGWEVEKIVDASNRSVNWLITSQSTGAALQTQPISLFLQANDTDRERTATLTLKAGRLRYPIAVSQAAMNDLKIKTTNQADTAKVRHLHF